MSSRASSPRGAMDQERIDLEMELDSRSKEADNSLETESDKRDAMITLYVSGLARQVQEDDLRELFTPFGHLSRVQVVTDPHTKDNRGFGFISYAEETAADAAIAAIHGKELHGRVLSVERAKRDKPRSPTPGHYYGAASKSSKRGRGRSDQFRSRRGGDRYLGSGSRTDDRSRGRLRRSRSPRRDRSHSRGRDVHSYGPDHGRDRFPSNPNRYPPASALYPAPPVSYYQQTRDRGEYTYDTAVRGGVYYQPAPSTRDYGRPSNMYPPPGAPANRYDPSFAVPMSYPPGPVDYERRYPPPVPSTSRPRSPYRYN